MNNETHLLYTVQNENHVSFIYRDIYKNVDEFTMQIATVSVLTEFV